MRVSVARGTGVKRETCPFWLWIGTFNVALRALDFGVLPGQRILGPAMIKPGDDLPVAGRVTLLALFSKPPLMFIGMAGGALARNAQEGAIKVLDANS